MYNGNLNLKKTNVNIEWTKEQLKEYKKCQNSCEYFIEHYVKIVHVDHGWINFKLRPFQKKLMDSIIDNRFTIAKVPRQQGKSILVVGVLLWYVLFFENCSIALLAQKGDQAQELLSRLQLSYEALPVWMQQGILEWNKRSIKLENGSDIIASSTSSGNIRGKTKSIVYLDEFAHVPQHIQEDFFASVYPTISSGESTKMIITSTPLGLNLFYKIWVESEQGRNSYNRVEAHWSEVPGRDEKWKADTIKNTSERQFKQEFEVEFLGSSDTLIDGATLRRLVHINPIASSIHLKVYEKPEKDMLYSVMVDVAEGTNQDCSAFVVFNMSKHPFTIAATYRNNEISPLVFPNVIEEVAKRYNDAYVLIETNNIGQQVADILFRDIEYEFVLMTSPSGKNGLQISSGFGSNSKVGIRTTKQTKRIGCSNLKSLVENDKLLVQDYDLIYELSRFTLQGGSYKAESGNYDDLTMCCVIFGWFQEQQFAKDLSNSNMRINLYNKNIDSIEADLMPVGQYTTGDETIPLVVTLVNQDFNKWLMDESD